MELSRSGGGARGRDGSGRAPGWPVPRTARPPEGPRAGPAIDRSWQRLAQDRRPPAVPILERPRERGPRAAQPLAQRVCRHAGTVSGFITGLAANARESEFTPALLPRFAAGASEALVAVFFGLACLTVAWLLVAVGMQRGVEP